MDRNEFPKATVFNLNNAVEYAEHAIVSKTVLKRDSGNISLFAFSKKEGLSEHTAPFDATVLGIDGKALITIGGKEFALTAGEMIVMPANVPHSVKAIEDFKMMLVMIKSVGS